MEKNSKRNLYLFSGFGADYRVFKNLMLQDFNTFLIQWPRVTEGTTKDEFLQEIKSQIHTSKRNVFLGVSFGGIIAQDLATIIKPDCLVLISSVETDSELPKIAKSSWATLLIKLLPKFALNKPNPLLNFMFSIKTQEGRSTLAAIVRETPPTFTKWALRYITAWRQPIGSHDIPIFRIHGDSDRIFPLKKMQRALYIIPRSGHFAVFEEGITVSVALADIFE